MKKLSKLLAVLLAMVMVVTCFAACTKEESSKDDEKETTASSSTTEESTEEEKPDEKDEEEAVEKAVMDFADARFISVSSIDDLEDALDYCTEDGKMYEELEEIINEWDSQIESAAAEDGADVSVVEEFLLSFISIGNENVEIEIDSIEVDGDEAKVETTITEIDEEEFMDVLIEVLNEYYSQTEDIDEAYELVIDSMGEIVEDINPVEQEETVTLEKVDDEWLIVKIK